MIDVVNLSVELVLMIGSAILGSYLTYIFSIRQSLKERILAERVKLYKPLLDFLDYFTEPHGPEEWEKLESKVNQLYKELLLFAPDHVINAFLDVMKKVKKGTKAGPLVEFMIILRKEIIGKTNVTPDSVVSIELRP